MVYFAGILEKRNAEKSDRCLENIMLYNIFLFFAV